MREVALVSYKACDVQDWNLLENNMLHMIIVFLKVQLPTIILKGTTISNGELMYFKMHFY